MGQLLIVEGPDRCGKSSIIEHISRRIVSPNKVCCHFGKPPIGLDDVNDWSVKHYSNLFTLFSSMVYNGFDVLVDRFHIGETVYGVKYRGQNPDIIFEVEQWYKSLPIKLIHCTDTAENAILRSDGQELESGLEDLADTIRMFRESFDRSAIPHKLLLNCSDHSLDEMKTLAWEFYNG